MIRGKGNLGCNYWCNHLPTDFEITPWERELLREYYLKDLRMIPEQELDYQSKELKLMIDFGRRMNYFLSE
ncbi:hypothetical protein N9R63_03540 [Flavobacteriaceae bacterium]|nr:hypothetical protein [Flavobacteriaceae bacterium]